MAAIAFTRNYSDHSNDTGYQFEFNCDKCGNGYGRWVCPQVCWNGPRAMCEECAPDLAQEAAHHQAHIAAQQIADKMRKQDLVGDIDVTAPMQGACQHCKARIQPGTKFCAECGKPTAVAAKAAFCTGCGGKLAAGAKFCGECGQPQG